MQKYNGRTLSNDYFDLLKIRVGWARATKNEAAFALRLNEITFPLEARLVFSRFLVAEISENVNGSK